MRHNMFITNITGGEIHRKRGRGRSKETNLGNIKKLISYIEKMKRLADKIEDWLYRQGKAIRQNEKN